MNMDAEWNRLSGLYAAKSDDELLHMQGKQDDLTSLAQQVLADVVKRRGLSVEQQTESASAAPGQIEAQLAEYEAAIWTFQDMLDLSRATTALQQADIEFRLVDQSDIESATGPRSARRVTAITVVIRTRDSVRARRLIEASMGIAPGDPDDPFADLKGLLPVGIFDRDSALRVAAALGQEGISYVWNDPHDDPDGAEGAILLEVRDGSLKRAQQVADTAVQAMLDAGE